MSRSSAPTRKKCQGYPGGYNGGSAALRIPQKLLIQPEEWFLLYVFFRVCCPVKQIWLCKDVVRPATNWALDRGEDGPNKRNKIIWNGMVGGSFNGDKFNYDHLRLIEIFISLPVYGSLWITVVKPSYDDVYYLTALAVHGHSVLEYGLLASNS